MVYLILLSTAQICIYIHNMYITCLLYISVIYGVYYNTVHFQFENFSSPPLYYSMMYIMTSIIVYGLLYRRKYFCKIIREWRPLVSYSSYYRTIVKNYIFSCKMEKKNLHNNENV